MFGTTSQRHIQTTIMPTSQLAGGTDADAPAPAVRTARRWRARAAALLAIPLLAATSAVALAAPAEAATPKCRSYGSYHRGEKGTMSYRYVNAPIAEDGYWPINQPLPYWTWRCSMRYGDNNGAVAYLQRELNLCYPTIIGAQLSVDGQFGPRTKAALVKVQQYHRIYADGQYGPQTAATITHRGAAASPYGFLPTCMSLSAAGVI